MEIRALSIVMFLLSFSTVNCSNDFYVYNLATDMIRETDVVFDGGFRTKMSIEEYLEQDNDMLRIAEIHSRNPRFSWMIASSKNNTYQRKYRILVASSKSLIDSEQGDLWDSGLVEDSSSVAVKYDGAPLNPSTLYYWKVMVVDSHGRKSDFSPAKAFVTAIDFDNYTSVLPIEKEAQQPERLVSKGSTVLADFGKDAFSQFSIRLNSLVGCDTVVVHLGEDLDSLGMVNKEPKGTIRYRKINIPLSKGYVKYTTVIEPDAMNTDPNAGWGGMPVLMPGYIGEVLPFRYAQIDNYDGIARYNNITRSITFYPMGETGTFTSSDTILNQVWELCKYSMKATSFGGLFVDGDRERVTYEGDVYINQLSYYAVSDQYSIARASLERLMFHSTWPTEWFLQTLEIAYNDYLYTGDISFLERYYEQLKLRTFRTLHDDEDNLLHSGKEISDEYLLLGLHTPFNPIRDIVDWPQGERDHYVFGECNTSVQAYYYKALDVFSKIAAALGNHYDARQFSRLASLNREAINRRFVNLDGLYVDSEMSQHSSLHANMYPVAMGVADKANYQKILKLLKQCGMACSVYGAQFMLDAVYECGDPDYALDLMTDTTNRSWYDMIRRGSTITMEAWGEQFKKNLDWNHAWGAAPGNIIARRLMGITPLEPGFSKVSIKPRVGRLSYALIQQPTPRGMIKMDINNEGGKAKVTVEIPPNMTAEIDLPGVAKNEVVGSGKWTFYYKR